MRRSILLLSANQQRRDRLAAALIEAGYGVEARGSLQTAGGEDVLDRPGGPTLTIVDAAPEGGEDESAWSQARALAGGQLIVLVDSPRRITDAFALGAEDCVLAEAHPDEIVARVEAVLRRTAAGPEGESAPSVYVDRRLWINYGSRQVWVQGEPAPLTPREFRLLRHLVAHRDQTLDHEEILGAVWGREPADAGPTEVLKQYIWRLRQKIEADPESPRIVVTVPGAGYRFVSAA
jgi:two-component system KDP operon response regulator KdpE